MVISTYTDTLYLSNAVQSLWKCDPQFLRLSYVLTPRKVYQEL
jgi:hypothetical protein